MHAIVGSVWVGPGCLAGATSSNQCFDRDMNYWKQCLVNERINECINECNNVCMNERINEGTVDENAHINELD